AIALKWEVTADGLQLVCVQQLFELLRRKIVGAGGLNGPEPIIAHFLERGGHILREFTAQAIELQADGAFETGADAGRLLSRNDWSLSDGERTDEKGHDGRERFHERHY